jgi:phosphoribosyl-AMP cyclohydrolase
MPEFKTAVYARRGSASEIEKGGEFQPRFDADGLIGAIATDKTSGEVLMFAHMNAEALAASIETGYAHFWSRSRGKLWKKGEESGNLLRLAEIRVDCDQDVLLLICEIEGPGVACHTGAKSCFYRRLTTARTATGAVALENAAPPKHK